ncbi:hypothetical protein TNCT_625581 [Trichonephila clavata]|uniref:Uncharacterized protein n=1 Tax=Trichonephila clavata TaxID=2740835 RepID=A0A8X6LSL7_TRICU|nr:hypothetical protein TNCT_625581 [Trichonephila clavata]
MRLEVLKHMRHQFYYLEHGDHGDEKTIKLVLYNSSRIAYRLSDKDILGMAVKLQIKGKSRENCTYFSRTLIPFMQPVRPRSDCLKKMNP